MLRSKYLSMVWDDSPEVQIKRPVNPVMKLGKFYRSARKVKEKIDPFTIEELHRIQSKCGERSPEF